MFLTAGSFYFIDIMMAWNLICVSAQDVMILDPSVFAGVADIHDRHRDMRLDVDSMTYEVNLVGKRSKLIHPVLEFLSV